MGPSRAPSTDSWKRVRACSASVTKWRHGSASVNGSMRASFGARGMAAPTRPAQPSRPSRIAPMSPPPVRMPRLAPTPRARIPEGEVTARATGGVKNRSRRDNPAMQAKATAGAGAQKLETTAMSTLVMLRGSLES